MYSDASFCATCGDHPSQSLERATTVHYHGPKRSTIHRTPSKRVPMVIAPGKPHPEMDISAGLSAASPAPLFAVLRAATSSRATRLQANKLRGNLGLPRCLNLRTQVHHWSFHIWTAMIFFAPAARLVISDSHWDVPETLHRCA